MRGFFIWCPGPDEDHRSGSTNCEAICYERASAKPAGDKQPKGCLDSSAPTTQTPIQIESLGYAGLFYMAASPCVRNDQNAQTTNYRHLMHTLNNYLTRSKTVKLHINF